MVNNLDFPKDFAFIQFNLPGFNKNVVNTISSEGTFIWPVLNKIDSNDLLGLISTQFSKYQNFHTLFIIKRKIIFFWNFLPIEKKGYFCSRKQGEMAEWSIAAVLKTVVP